MRVYIPYRWKLLKADVVWQSEHERWYGTIPASPMPIRFTTKSFFKIIQAARWSLDWHLGQEDDE